MICQHLGGQIYYPHHLLIFLIEQYHIKILINMLGVQPNIKDPNNTTCY